MEKAKLLTPMDIAKLLGVENEYREEVLIEQELKITRENFMNEEIEPEENNCINGSINHEQS